MHDTLDYWSTDPLHRALAPQPAHLRAHLRLGRALRAAAQPRRGGAPQGPLLGKMPGDDVAAVRQPAGAVRVDVGPPRQAAAVHGRRAGRAAASGPTTRARLGPARRPAPRRRAAPRRRPQRHPGPPPRPARVATATRPASRGSPSTTRPTACSPSSGGGPGTDEVSCASPTSRASTPRTTGSAWPGRVAGVPAILRVGGARRAHEPVSRALLDGPCAETSQLPVPDEHRHRAPRVGTRERRTRSPGAA